MARPEDSVNSQKCNEEISGGKLGLCLCAARPDSDSRSFKHCLSLCTNVYLIIPTLDLVLNLFPEPRASSDNRSCTRVRFMTVYERNSCMDGHIALAHKGRCVSTC